MRTKLETELKEFRKRHKLTQKGLADLCHISSRTITNVETGRNCNESTKHLIADVIKQIEPDNHIQCAE